MDKRPRGTGSKRLRGRVWQLRYWHDGELIEESTGTSNEAVADRMLRDRLRTAGTPTFVGPKAEKVSFGDLEGLITRDYAFKKNRSTKRLEQSLGHLRDWFSLKKAMAITPQDIDAYTEARLALGAKAATVNRELAALRRMFRLAVRKQVLPSAPVITLLREDNAREGFIDPADFDAFLNELRALGEGDVADAVEFGYLTLARRANVLRAQWSWFTFDVGEDGIPQGGAARLPGAVTKNGKPLALPLNDRLLDVIRRRWKVRVPACPYIFHRRGRRIVRFDRPWELAAATVGRPGLLFHDLRRSGARNYRRAGVAEDVIMRIGGWRTRSMFQRYNIVDEADLIDASAALSRYLRQPGARKVRRLSERTGTRSD